MRLIMMTLLDELNGMAAAAARRAILGRGAGRPWRGGVALLLCLLATSLLPAQAADATREQEIDECRSGELGTWGDGQDRAVADSPLLFVYDHADAPAWFDATLVATKVSKAARAWSQCGVPGRLAGDRDGWWETRQAIRVQWSDKESGGNFGLANLTRRTLSLSPKAFGMLRERNPRYDATTTLQMTISHEMGHFFGLMAHSRRCVDVLSYYHNERGEQCRSRAPMAAAGVVEYRHAFPTACDIERCRRINGKPPLPGGRLEALR